MSRVYHNTKSFVALVSEIHANKYDYSETVFTKMKNKITVVCPEHGKFFPEAGNHKKTGCPLCYDKRRGDSLVLSEKSFLRRMTELFPLYSPAYSFYKDGSNPVSVSCKKHGDIFPVTPCRLLVRKALCPSCLSELSSSKAKERSKSKIKKALASLPSLISCLEVEPGWSTVSKFLCKTHGVFSSELDRAVGKQYVCNECAKGHFTGATRVSFSEYSLWVKRLFPSPPSAIRVIEESYLSNAGTKQVSLLCEEHGVFTRNRSTVNNGKLGTPCPYCKKHNASTPELEMIEFVRALEPCTQGDRVQISPKELDCFVPSSLFAVEMCGLYWHSAAKVDKFYHLNKSLACKEKGIRLVHFFEDEWYNQRPICESIISSALGRNSSVYARKLSLRTVGFSEVKEFFQVNHIQGFTPAQRYLVLEDRSGVVRAAASFSFSRLKKDQEWELVRYCSVLGTSVVGGLSRLVKNFLRREGADSLISYCSLRVFTGKGYEAAGFEHLSDGAPTYFHTNKIERFSRHVTKKNKLKKLLPSFDESLSESANMEKAGYLKIWDCGSALYRFTL